MPPASPHQLSRDQILAIVKGDPARGIGPASVIYNGRHIRSEAEVPLAEEMAQGDAAAMTLALGELDKLQRELDRRREVALRGMVGHLIPPSGEDVTLAADPRTARHRMPADVAASKLAATSPDDRLRIAYDVVKESYGYPGTFEDFKSEHERRVAQKAKLEAEAEEARKGEPQEPETPKDGDLTQAEIVERENRAIEEGKGDGGEEDEDKAGDPPPGKGHRRGHR